MKKLKALLIGRFVESVAEENQDERVKDLEARFVKTIEIALSYGMLKGTESKMWCIDQMLRTLLKEEYEDIIQQFKAPSDKSSEGYEWSIGTEL